MDTLNGEQTDAIARAMRPRDYEDGRGLSEAGRKVEPLLLAADARAAGEIPIQADTSWMNPRGSYV